jgi:hypothetical protein
MTMRMRIECWIPKSTNTHSECVIHMDFPLKQWLQERDSMLRYTYIACLVCANIQQGEPLESETDIILQGPYLV